MHKSRFGGLIIDCKTEDLGAAAEFWSKALGAPPKQAADPEKSPYVELGMPPDEPYIEVQKVDHASRVHLDIETDDLEAEAARLEKLGAKRIADIDRWIVMEAPTGQRFCIVPVYSRKFAETANRWG